MWVWECGWCRGVYGSMYGTYEYSCKIKCVGIFVYDVNVGEGVWECMRVCVRRAVCECGSVCFV